MNNPLDLFAWKLRSERKRQHLTQKALAERLHMSVRTIIECQLVDDDENGCLTYEIRKGRFGFKLNAPYSAERRKAASELAKKNIKNLQQGKK